MKEKMKGMACDIDDVKGFIVQIFEKLRFLTNTAQISSGMNHGSSKEDILVAGVSTVVVTIYSLLKDFPVKTVYGKRCSR